MGTINKVTIMGLIGMQPEMLQTKNGKAYARMSVATHKRVRDENGQYKRETQWHKIMLWGKNAENFATYCEKGAPIYVEGHLSPYLREVNGQKIWTQSIVADQIQFIPGSRPSTSAERGEYEEMQDSPDTSNAASSDSAFGTSNDSPAVPAENWN